MIQTVQFSYENTFLDLVQIENYFEPVQKHFELTKRTKDTFYENEISALEILSTHCAYLVVNGH